MQTLICLPWATGSSRVIKSPPRGTDGRPSEHFTFGDLARAYPAWRVKVLTPHPNGFEILIKDRWYARLNVHRQRRFRENRKAAAPHRLFRTGLDGSLFSRRPYILTRGTSGGPISAHEPELTEQARGTALAAGRA